MPERPPLGRGARLAFIGGGQMAEALIAGLLASGVSDSAGLYATDISRERQDLLKRRFGIRVGSENAQAVVWADRVVLAVKPHTVDRVLEELAPILDARLLISIAAGVSINRLRARLPASARVVRVMPNAPALVCEGMAAVAYGSGVTEQDKAVAHALLQAVGRVTEVEESLMDAVTGLSGSGPAYVFLAMEALADGGVKMGLPRAVAQLLAAQTTLGAARTILESGQHLRRLKDRVASPGGTTHAGLQALEHGGLRACLMAAVEAATKRSGELNH